MALKTGNTDQVFQLAEDLAIPFARAFAVFVRTIHENERGKPFSKALDTLSRDPAVRKALERRLANAVAENDAAERAGRLREFEFKAGSPSEAVADRIKAIAKERGVSQNALASRLGVSPAVISRILRNPDRSKLDTLRRIADALDVSVRELV
jgi:ribosome-binding protein aMBF1 (putative translation factor)